MASLKALNKYRYVKTYHQLQVTLIRSMALGCRPVICGMSGKMVNRYLVLRILGRVSCPPNAKNWTEKVTY